MPKQKRSLKSTKATPGPPQTPKQQTGPLKTSPYFRKTPRSPDSDDSVSPRPRAKAQIRTPDEDDDQVGNDSIPMAKARTRARISGAKVQVQRPVTPSTQSMKGLRLVLRNTHSDQTVPMVVRLLHVKPRLLQGYLFHKPWWLLIAAILLNKTTGKAATPVLYKIMSRWPDMDALSKAAVPELQGLLRPLGLAAIRTQRLILFANMYLNDPPSQSEMRTSRVQVAKGEPKYPDTAVSHLPGMGRYALDSYRLFCCRLVGEDDWKNLMPHDKELRVYVRWRWAILGKVWDSKRGVIGLTTDEYLNDLCEGLLNNDCTAPAYLR